MDGSVNWILDVPPMSKQPVKWGILACGNIANAFAEAVNATESSVLHAVAARDVSRAQEFAQKHGAMRAYGSYEALLADPEVEAVYIATLHPFHLEWMTHAFQAGKHVLCEKPITMNLREAKRAQDIAKQKSCLLREAFMYRHHPQTQQVVDLVTSGVIGKVRMIEASFCFNTGVCVWVVGVFWMWGATVCPFALMLGCNRSRACKRRRWVAVVFWMWGATVCLSAV